MKKLAGAVLAVMAFSAPAFAMGDPDVVYEPDREVVLKETRVTFGQGAEVDGELQKPDEILIRIYERPTFANRIPKRTSFTPELLRSVDNL